MKRLGLFSIIMIFTIGLVIILSVFIPLRKAYQSKNDRLIEQHLNGVSYSIDEYYSENNKLPDNLNDLSFKSSYKDSKVLVDKNLIAYKKINSNVVPVEMFNKSINEALAGIVPKTSAKYELCVEYKFGDKSVKPKSADDSYTTYLDVKPHPAGHVCYNLSTN